MALKKKTLRNMSNSSGIARKKGVKKSVCLSGSKNQAQYYDKSLGRETKVSNSVQSASLRTLAYRSHFLVFSSQP